MGEAGELSEFELLTTMAITWFAREKTDLCVIECGLGGRGDATDVFDHPVAAVLTPSASTTRLFWGIPSRRSPGPNAVSCGPAAA